MKKTLITLAMLAASTIAASAASVYENTFDSFTDKFSTVDVSDADARISDLNLSTDTGFTISINIMADSTITPTSVTWGHILGLSFDGVTPPESSPATATSGYCQLNWQGATTADGKTTGYGFGINPKYFNDNALASGDNALSPLVWYNTILTVEGTTWTLNIYDSEGNAVSTMTDTMTDAAFINTTLTDLYIGGVTTTHNKALTQIDNLAVYDTLLTDEQKAALSISTLSGNGIPSIPEPTTATLSILALAGLCARRRRK
ncbi:MAG: hypothetical protein R3Y56_02210 [Akkermansia sp.]